MRIKFQQTMRSQYGQAMAETIVILMAAIMLIFGAIQFALFYNAKTTINYATFEATRAGALNYGDRRAIEYAFAGGLSPLYTSIDEADSMLDNVESVQTARNRILDEIDAGEFVCMERLNPQDSAFNAHGIDDPLGRFDTVIPNDHLKYRSTDDNGSDVSIQDANLLKMKVTYCYPMFVPVVSTVIQRLMGVQTDPDPLDNWNTPNLGSFRDNCFANNRIPIVSQAIVRMQTPIKNDSFDDDCS